MLTCLQKAGRADRWSIIHGFYVGMGGLVIDLDNSFVRSPFRATLTPSGVSLLAKRGHLPPNISKDFIDDKSKADDFAKFLVCVQSMWCFLQYIGRVAGHLPVTLLEVNTLGHALCALAIYACWWHKPFDIKHPYVLQDKAVPPNLCAYMWMCSYVSCKSLDVDKEDQECRYVELSTEGANIDDQSTNDQLTSAVLPNDVQPIEYQPNGEPVELREGQDLPGTLLHFNRNFFLPLKRTSLFPWHRYWVTYDTFLLQREDVRRWRLANEALDQYGELSK
jgi:hypothetical protein